MKIDKIKTISMYLVIILIVKSLIENIVKNMFLSNLLIFAISLISIVIINSIVDALKNSIK
ncbi:hypothetical protein R3379_36820 [Bacillus sp. BAU-SS-2023]|nr:hypothetical protein [Bacillus sp. BAU-SS-2023]